jgi:transcription elongation factor Elf1
MSRNKPLGTVYFCPICGVEISVISLVMGDFTPRCCDVDMIPKPGKLTFYVCPLCGAEIAVLNEGTGRFSPRCCDTAMQLIAA